MRTILSLALTGALVSLCACSPRPERAVAENQKAAPRPTCARSLSEAECRALFEKGEADRRRQSALNRKPSTFSGDLP